MASRSSSSSAAFGIPMGLAFLPMILLLLDDDPALQVLNNDTQKIASMTAASAQEAVNTGMLKKLAPYFSECQEEHNITPGISKNVTAGQADDVIACMRHREEYDYPAANVDVHSPNDGEKWNSFLKASMAAPDFEYAHDLGIVSSEMQTHFATCQQAHNITAGDSNTVTYEIAQNTYGCLKAKITP